MSELQDSKKNVKPDALTAKSPGTQDSENRGARAPEVGEMVRRVGQSKMRRGLGLLFGHSPAQLYHLLGQPSEKAYLNLGYWPAGSNRTPGIPAVTLEEAAEELVREIGRLAELSTANRLLDVGFGFGQQDVLWARELNCASIFGVNITALHVAGATERAAQERLSERIQYQQGDACRLAFREGAFDRVIALECAFHFNTRHRFISEAYRVLAPGGILVTADIITGDPFGGGSLPWSYRLFGSLQNRFWQIPSENWYSIERYRQILEQSGFEVDKLEDVSDSVLLPFVDRCLDRPFENQPWLLRRSLAKAAAYCRSGALRYIFSKAVKRP